MGVTPPHRRTRYNLFVLKEGVLGVGKGWLWPCGSEFIVSSLENSIN